MSSRTARILVGTTMDGQTITYKTAAPYDTFGVCQNSADGTWMIVSKGNSADSVRSRARTEFRRGGRHYAAMDVIRMYEQAVKPITDYFASHPVFGHVAQQHIVIKSVYIPGLGWTSEVPDQLPADKAMNIAGSRPTAGWLRDLARRYDVRAVSVGARRSSEQADFQLRYLGLRVSKCATIGCGGLAMWELTYSLPQDRETEFTELVCKGCKDSYENRPALKATAI